MWQFPLFPDQASTIAHQIDLVYFVLLGLGAFFGIGVAVVLVYFAVKYRASSDVDRSNPTTDNLVVEATWTLIPLGLAMGMFVWGAVVYSDVQQLPSDDSLEIYAVGKQWMWQFQHRSGVREINTLHVPLGRPVKLIMTSQDVIHSFYVPAFRVKQDVLPGRFTYAWFEATNVGEYHLFCAEYCGTQHSLMRGRVQVMDPEAYERWLRLGDEEDAARDDDAGRFGRAERAQESPPAPGGPADDLSQDGAAMAAAGEALFVEFLCNTCHRTDSSALAPSTGPVLENVYGRRVRLQNEREIIADEQYLQESILYPHAKLVQGYPPVMPIYAGQIAQTELTQLVAYLKSLQSDQIDEAASDTTEGGI